MSPGSSPGEGGCHRTGKGSQVATTMGNSKESSGAKRVVERLPRVCLGSHEISRTCKNGVCWRKVAPAPEESATSLSSSLGSLSWEAGKRDLKQKGPCFSLNQLCLTFCNRKPSIEVSQAAWFSLINVHSPAF